MNPQLLWNIGVIAVIVMAVYAPDMLAGIFSKVKNFAAGKAKEAGLGDLIPQGVVETLGEGEVAANVLSRMRTLCPVADDVYHLWCIEQGFSPDEALEDYTRKSDELLKENGLKVTVSAGKKK